MNKIILTPNSVFCFFRSGSAFEDVEEDAPDVEDVEDLEEDLDDVFDDDLEKGK